MADETKPAAFEPEPMSEAPSLGAMSRSPGGLLDGVIARKYKLTKLLGQGGMGEVYRALHLTLGIDVAVKVMHSHVATQGEFARRFAREARAVSVLNHPNIVRVLDFGADDGLPYIVMEFLRGEALQDRIDREPAPLPLAEVREIMTATLGALSTAHEHGVVHRDIKPDNVFLADEGGRTVPKLVDFGLAHVDDRVDAGPTLTKTEMIAGTPDYMSPEQCRSLRVGPSSDLYAMGCVLTTLLQRRPPFEGTSTIDLITKHLFSPVPPLARPDGAEAVPDALERLRLDLLAKDPVERPATAAETASRLAEALDPGSLARRMGDREDRALHAERALRVAFEPASRAASKVEGARVGVVLVGAARALGDAHQQGLTMHGITLEPATATSEIVVVDAGDELEAAKAALRALAPGQRALVCLSHLDVERMNQLIAAGAADVIGAPVAVDGLAKKLGRLLRKRR